MKKQRSRSSSNHVRLCTCKHLTQCCCCTLLTLLIILYFILFQAHHIGCSIFAAHNNGIRPTHLCEPWMNVIYAFVELPSPISNKEQLIAYSKEINEKVINSSHSSLCRNYSIHQSKFLQIATWNF